MHVDFPFHVDSRGRTAQTDYAHHVRDMVEQLLFTRPGERVNRPDLGCGVHDLVFAENGPELAAATRLTTQAAMAHHLGDVLTVVAVDAVATDSTLRVAVTYVITATGREHTATIEGGRTG